MRENRFPVMLSKEERQLLRSLARVEGGLSCAAVVRRLIRKEGQRKGLWHPHSYESLAEWETDHE